jgi:hypothetical protein
MVLTADPEGARLPDLLARAAVLADSYAGAEPFPHVVIDGLFDTARLAAVAEELPSRAPGWKVYDTPTERKQVFDRPEDLGPLARGLADELSGTEFVRFLECLTGIDGLVPDPHLTEAGFIDVPPGGFLHLHLDFTRSRRLSLVRRVNVLVYLNDGWQSEWGGQLEFWRTATDGPVQRIVPVINRTVVFSTPDALHGHPEPVAAPGGRHRLCFSAYYFTSPDADRARAHGVRFVAGRPPSSWKQRVRRLLPPVLYDYLKSVRRRIVRARKRSR